MIGLFEVGLINAALATVLAVAVWLATRVWRHPVLVHTLWVVVLVKLITPPMVAIPWRLPAATTAIEHAPAPWNHEPVGFVANSTPLDFQTPAPAAVAQPMPATLQVAQPSGDVPDHIAPQLDEPESSQNAEAADLSSESLPWPSIVIAAWLTGSAIVLMISVVRLARFHRVLIGAAPAPAEIEQLTNDLATRLSVAGRYQLRLTDARLSPLVWPIGRPTILIPHALVRELSREELSTLLSHELAHLRRRDHWVRWLELLVATIYWWHPLVWWARVAIRQAEEAACDSWVVWAYPNASDRYASALFKVVQFVSEPRQATPIIASALGSGGDLLRAAQ